MSTEDDLRHMGQAAAALVGVAAARAKQVAEQLLGNRDKGREEVKRRGGGFVEEGRQAAADVVGALRREASVILHDLEHLEESLRAREGEGAGSTTTGTSTGTTAGTTAGTTTGIATVEAKPEPAKRTPAKRSAAKRSAAKRSSAGGAKAAPGGKSAATKAAKPNATREAAPRAKAAGGRKAAGPRKTTGGAGPSGEGQG